MAFAQVLNKMGSDDEADEGQGHATWALEHVGGGAGSRGNGDAHGQNGAGAVTDAGVVADAVVYAVVDDVADSLGNMQPQLA